MNVAKVVAIPGRATSFERIRGDESYGLTSNRIFRNHIYIEKINKIVLSQENAGRKRLLLEMMMMTERKREQYFIRLYRGTNGHIIAHAKLWRYFHFKMSIFDGDSKLPAKKREENSEN